MLQLYELLRDIESGAVKVCVYPLGKRVTHEIVFIPRERNRRFEKELERITGIRIVNHSCYCLKFQDGAEAAFQLTDGQLIVGVGIEPV